MLGTAVVPWHLKHLHQKYLADTPMLSNIQYKKCFGFTSKTIVINR